MSSQTQGGRRSPAALFFTGFDVASVAVPFYSRAPNMCLASIVMTEVESSAIVDFATGAAETTHSKPPVERLLDGEPTQVARNYFSDSSGRFFAGVWESTPGKWRVSYSENEFCHITRGRIRIQHESGRSWTFAAGASFVIPAGFSGVWEVLEPTSKLYVIYEPA